MARRRQKKSSFKQLIIFLVVICIAQVGFQYAFKKEDPKTISDAIHSSLDKRGDLGSAEKEQMRIQAALLDHTMQNGGTPPAKLDELVPKYFASVPVNPDTGKPFEYKIVDGVAYVGQSKKTPKGKKSGSKPSLENMSPEDLLIASLDIEQEDFVYDVTGKRDPFRPFNLAPVSSIDTSKPPLQRFDIGQLKLTAILEGFDKPKALIEIQNGKGYTVTEGMKIGLNGGEIIKITKDKVMILEKSTDFTGKQTTKTIEMRLRTKDQDTRLNEFGEFSVKN